MNESEFIADLAFVHISDIHFRKGRMGDVHDVDSDLRNEIERDLRTVRPTRIQKLDGIVISGDIAFGGQPEEFSYASGWIEKIRELLDCPKEGIMTIPGNHDVDRAVLIAGGDVDKLHDQIRQAKTLPERDEMIAEILRDHAKGVQLFSSIAAYNDFAKEYVCSVKPGAPYWERDFALGNRGTLRIRGMTSTLISGPRDHAVTHRVVYGGAQRTLLRENNVYRLVVGHHPPSWTLEGDDADKCFSERAAIQLYGHKHDQWYAKAGKSIRLIAGAVHPERMESQWEPRYSFIAVRLDETGRLLTRVYPRKWSREETTFIGDFNSQGHDYRDSAIEPE
jgi:predicted MPP superfamily phosphohydrolase